MLVGSWVRDKLKILDFPPLNLVDYFNSTSFRTLGLDGFILASIKQKRDQLEEGQLTPSQYIKLGGVKQVDHMVWCTGFLIMFYSASSES